MGRRISRKLIITLLMSLSVVSLTLSSKKAGAFWYLCCDNCDDPITWSETCNKCARMKMLPVSFPSKSIWNNLSRRAMASWNLVNRCDFNFLIGLDTNNTFDHSNGVNEVYFFNTDGSGNTLAVTWLRYNDCLPFDDADIHEADVEFDVDESWYTTAFSYTSSNINFELVAVHEFGHALGLSPRQDLHEDRVLARLNSFYPNGGPITRSRLVQPLADDRAGARFLYPGSGTARADLVASNYKRTGSGTSGLVSSPDSASRGSSVTVEFTFMNIGNANSGSFNIGFYLSTNDTILTADRLIGTNTGASVSAGGVVTFSRELTIPNTVTPGTYYMGILLDKDNDVVEWSNSNNGLAQPRTITIN